MPSLTLPPPVSREDGGREVLGWLYFGCTSSPVGGPNQNAPVLCDRGVSEILARDGEVPTCLTVEAAAQAAATHLALLAINDGRSISHFEGYLTGFKQMKITTLGSVHLRSGPESFVVATPSEETITNGIIRVTGTTKKVVYFVEGHGEPDVANTQDGKGYSNAKLALEQENYEVNTLVLPSAEQIPDDASIVIMAGPRRTLTAHEVRVLDEYLRGGGKLFAMIGPRQRDEGLLKLLSSWGAKLGNDIVIDQKLRLFQGPTMGIEPMTKTYGVHPITQSLRDYSTYPQTRTVEA